MRVAVSATFLLAGCLQPSSARLVPPPAAPIASRSDREMGATAAAATLAIPRREAHASGEELAEPPIAPGAAKEARDGFESSRPAFQGPKAAFDLPPQLPGANAPVIRLPRFAPNTTAAERDKAIRAAYPALPAVPPIDLPAPSAENPPISLNDLQERAWKNSPVIRRAQLDVEAARGAMIQAGLPPNPTIGWEADQWQPGPKPKHNSGQQGGYFQQLIKTAGKCQLAQAVAAFDVIKAEIALRRAQVDLATLVRGYYFNVLVAEEGLHVYGALAQLADRVYSLQLEHLRGGESAAYEPLPFYTQAIQARNNLAQAHARYRYAWKELAATLNEPNLSPRPLAGRADEPIPDLRFEEARDRVLSNHTDLLTIQQTFQQAQVNVRLAERNRLPDVHTQGAFQHDNSVGNDQFNLQLGLNLPLWNKNQGNIYEARSQAARAGEDHRARQNQLVASLAEAFGRWEAARHIVRNYHDHILPALASEYRALYLRYQSEPGKVGFSDVFVAQFNYGNAVSAYLTALANQWSALVDIASLMQIDVLPAGSPREERSPAQPQVELLPAVPPMPKKN